MFHSNNFREYIYFSGAKMSDKPILSYERPCGPEYLLTKNMVLRNSRFQDINTYCDHHKNLFSTL